MAKHAQIGSTSSLGGTTATRHLLRMRDALVEAFAAADCKRFKTLVTVVSSMRIDASCLAATGLGVLFNDTKFQDSLESVTRVVVSACVQKWRKNWKCVESGPLRGAVHPLGGQKGQTFLDVVAGLEAWLMQVDEYGNGTATTLYRKAATQLALRRVSSWTHIVGVQPSELAGLGRDEVERALFHRAAMAAQDQDTRKRRRLVESSAPSSSSLPAAAEIPRAVVPPPFVQGGSSAGQIADKLNVQSLDEAASTQLAQEQSLGIPVLGGAKPRQAVAQLARITTADSMAVQSALRLRAQRLRLETQRNSLPSVASGLRAWHAFAVSVLKYEEGESLPPRSEDHVLMYVSIFRTRAQ